MSFHRLSLPTRAFPYRNTTPIIQPSKSFTVHVSEPLPHRRGQLASAFALLEKKVNRIRGSSSEICEYIDMYSTPNGDGTPSSDVQHAENIKPSTPKPLRAEFNHSHHVIEHQQITSPSSDVPLTPVAEDDFRLPLPDMGFTHFDTTSFSSPGEEIRNLSVSSNYPSEGIRSEECLTPPNYAAPRLRHVTFDISSLGRDSSGLRDRTSE